MKYLKVKKHDINVNLDLFISSVAPVYERTTVRRNVNHLHFFQQMKSHWTGLLSSDWLKEV